MAGYDCPTPVLFVNNHDRIFRADILAAQAAVAYVRCFFNWPGHFFTVFRVNQLPEFKAADFHALTAPLAFFYTQNVLNHLFPNF